VLLNQPGQRGHRGSAIISQAAVRNGADS